MQHSCQLLRCVAVSLSVLHRSDAQSQKLAISCLQPCRPLTLRRSALGKQLVTVQVYPQETPQETRQETYTHEPSSILTPIAWHECSDHAAYTSLLEGLG